MAAQQPTEKQLQFARNIASSLGLQLDTAEHDKTACRDFISKYRAVFEARSADLAPNKPQAAVSNSTARQPTKAQLDLAADLYNKLKNDPTWPSLAHAYSTSKQSFLACSKFISLAQAKRNELSYLQTLNDMDVVPAALREELKTTPDFTARKKIIERFKSTFRTSEDKILPQTPFLALTAYWSEAISQATFAGLATADNLLGGEKTASFSLDDLLTALEQSRQPELTMQGNEVTVRHLLVRLTRQSAGSQGKQHTVVCVMPLQAYPDESVRGYRWGRALKEIPRFNRELIGEEARIEGLGLVNADALGMHLEPLAERIVAALDLAQPAPTMADAWGVLDGCFECLTLTGGNIGLNLRGWIKDLIENQGNHRALRNITVTFALVDGGSAIGPTRHVANTLAQLQADPALFDAPELALMRNVANIKQSPAQQFDHDTESVHVSHLMRYSGHMDSRKKDRREAYPLDPAQRDAILAMQELRSGQLLAVNGPPGTGKTSLLRAVIASTWIDPLLNGSNDRPEAPLILASAATNQAVTNIISSFDETPGPILFDEEGELIDGAQSRVESRWLPWLVSYGWYAPAGNTDSSFDRYQQVKRRSQSHPWQFAGACAGLSELTPEDAKRAFLGCANDFLHSKHSLDTALTGLRNCVKEEWLAVKAIQEASTKWLTSLSPLVAVKHWGEPQKRQLLDLEVNSNSLERETAHLTARLSHLDAACAKLASRLKLIGLPQAAVATLKLVEAEPTHPKALEFTLHSEIEQQLRKLQEEIHSRLHSNFLVRLRDSGRAIFSAAEVTAERKALVDVVTQAGVKLDLRGGTSLLEIHDAISAHRLHLASQLDVLALQLLATDSLGVQSQINGGDLLTVTAQLKESLTAKLAAAESERDRMAAERRIKTRELNETKLALAELTVQRNAYLRLLRHAELACNTLVETLQRESAPAELTSCIQKLVESTLGESNNLTTKGLNDHTRTLLKLLQDRLDTHERLRLFHLAARYWEGRYVHEALAQQESARSDPAFRPSSSRQLRHLAMLGPVFVATAASTPKLMRRYLGPDDNNMPPYLFGEADLLIVDEAGQATPEGSITSFAFAKCAIVVGDVDQLVPVWSIDHASDSLLVKRFGLQRFAPDGDADPMTRLNDCGLMVSRGSIMSAAQNTTAVSTQDAAQRGLTLTNHYRCLAPIIDICNRMVYRGGLMCATPKPKSNWKPHLSRLAYLLVSDCGDTRQPGGSRANEGEARLIARWLRENQQSILAHFAPAGDKTLADLVGIVTPYKAQTHRIRKAVAEEFKEQQGKMDGGEETRLHMKMTIGTVHSLQGAEKEIVLFSMVDTQTPGEAQFYDQRHDLINVAVSRAKHMLIATLSQAAIQYGLGLTDRALAQGKPSDYLMHAMAHHGSRLNSQKVVVVESPNKCKTIHQALGGTLEFLVLATNGHIRQLKLPKEWDASTASVPEWGAVSPSGLRLMDELQFLWPGLTEFYMATDPDAEGETIAWHVLDVLASRLGELTATGHAATRARRMRFNTLRPEDILSAMEDAGEGLDQGLVKSALARTLLDHLIVGHLPVRLGLSSQPSLSAGVGRVQLGILDLVQRQACAPVYYEVHVSLPWGEPHYAPLVLEGALDGTPVRFESEEGANALASELQTSNKSSTMNWRISTRSRFEQVDGLPMVNTASFMALAHRAYGLKPQRTSALLQELYEGCGHGGEATTGEVDYD